MLVICSNASYTTICERNAASAQVIQALEQAVRNDRLKCIELQLPGFRRETYGDVVADDLERDLINHFGNDRIDFAGHDAGTRLHGREIDFAETGARS